MAVGLYQTIKPIAQQDLDEDELGGDILWLEPTDVRTLPWKGLKHPPPSF